MKTEKLEVSTMLQSSRHTPRKTTLESSTAHLRAGTRRSWLLLGGLGLLMLGVQHPAPANPPAGPAWTQTFDDEFNSTTPGSQVAGNIWIPQPIYYYAPDFNVMYPQPNYLPGNYSTALAYYLPGDVTEDGSGFLDLTTQAYNQTAYNGHYGNLPFSSGFMISQFQQAYGYYEVSMKPGISGGLDPTFWLIRHNSSPEIDIAEFPSGSQIYDFHGNGPFTGGNCVNQAVHTGGPTDEAIINTANYAQGFHTYGVDWEPTYMNFYIDGKISHPVASGFPIPTDPMNIQLSVQMQRDTDQTQNGQPDGNPDGAWFGSPFDTAAANPGKTPGIFPAVTQVDYVRVWQQNTLLPYTAPRPIPGVVQAEDYDLGGEGVAYHDSDPSNYGGAYRPQDAVDITNTYDTGGGYDVGWTAPGEYLKYTVNAAAAGTYAVSLRVGDPDGPTVGGPSGDSLHLLTPGGGSAAVSVPDTGGYETWASTAPVNVTLAAGVQTLELYEDTGGYNINSMTFTALGTLVNGSFESPSVGGGSYQYNPAGSGWTFTGNSGIQANTSAWGAANAPDGIQTAFIQTNSAQGGSVSNISQNVNFAAAGAYTLSFQAARRPYGGVQPIQVSLDGTNQGSPVTPAGLAFSPQSVLVTVATAGAHTLTLAGTAASGDDTTFVDKVALAPVTTVTVANSSFEAPSIGAGAYQYNPTGGSWTFQSHCGIQSNGSAWGASNAPDGTQTAFLQGGGGALGSISQSVTFPAAGTYTLSFQAARRSYGGVQPVQVSLDGVSQSSPVSPAGLAFSPQSVTLSVSSGGAHTLTLAATNSTGDNTSFVDKIAVTH